MFRQAGVKNVSTLRVCYPDGRVAERMMDDDIMLGPVRFIESGDWVVVINGPYALGGYDRATGLLVGEHEWDQLPFRTLDGRELSGPLPAGYPSP